MELADLGLPVTDLPNFNAPFDQSVAEMIAPQNPATASATSGRPSTDRQVEADQEEEDRPTTTAEGGLGAGKEEGRGAQDVPQVAEQTQRTHIQNSSRPSRRSRLQMEASAAAGALPRTARVKLTLNSSLYNGANHGLSQSLPEGAHLPLSGYSSANNLQIDTSVSTMQAGVMRPPPFGARGTSVSVPTTPLLAPEAGPFQGADRPVDSLSAPSSPTLRPALANIGRSGSSPGPSTELAISKRR